MSQPFEERLRDSSAASTTKTARILPFERPPSDLQRAVQLRAQEALDLERERRRTKPAPLRWAVIFVLALVPVLLIFAGVDAFVRAFHRINETYSKMPVPSSTTEQTAPPTTVIQEPGVVILQPLNEQKGQEEAQKKEDAQDTPTPAAQ